MGTNHDTQTAAEIRENQPDHEQKAPALGSYSSGTMRTEDLLPVCLEILEEHAPAALQMLLAHAPEITRDPLKTEDDWDRLTDAEREELEAWLNEEVWDTLNDLAPEYCYWGAHEGDGSDFGFWMSLEALSDARADKELQTGEDLPADHFLHVNDHGNATLYRVKLEEVWSVV